MSAHTGRLCRLLRSTSCRWSARLSTLSRGTRSRSRLRPGYPCRAGMSPQDTCFRAGTDIFPSGCTKCRSQLDPRTKSMLGHTAGSASQSGKFQSGRHRHTCCPCGSRNQQRTRYTRTCRRLYPCLSTSHTKCHIAGRFGWCCRWKSSHHGTCRYRCSWYLPS